MDKHERDLLVQKEKRETVTETVIRTKVDPNPSGYYDCIPGKEGYGAYLHDQSITSSGRAVKGKAARKAFEKFYGKTDMCEALILVENRKKGGRK